MRKIAIIVLVLMLAGCAVQNQPYDSGAAPQDINSVTSAGSKFAFDLYSNYSANEGNIFFSPFSISSAMAMAYEGAQGQTKKEIQSLFYFPQDQELRSAYAQLFNEINRKDKNYMLAAANALWAQQDFQFSRNYVDTIDRYYDGKITNLDFKGNPEGSRTAINNWVEEKTNEKIKDLIPLGFIKPATRLVLTNAIYFKAEWATQFDNAKTQKDEFRVSKNKTIEIDMMQRTDALLNYTQTDAFQILELPYAEDIIMRIFLPKEDGSGALSPETLIDGKNKLTEQRVNVFIPKFKFKTKYFMKDTLMKMGMPTAFSDNADFSKITGTPNLKISEVIHQAFIEVNEEGTEAAAATAIIMEKVTSIRPGAQIPTFRANHPFMFIIRQKDTGNILFMGRVSDPTMQ